MTVYICITVLSLQELFIKIHTQLHVSAKLSYPQVFDDSRCI